MIGFGVSGFRSFGANTQYFYPLEKINLIVGRNNVGKSNLLRLVQLNNDVLAQRKSEFQPLDEYIGERRLSFCWWMPLEAAKLKDECSKLIRPEQLIYHKPLLMAIVDELPQIDGVIWLELLHTDGRVKKFPDASKIMRSIDQKGKFNDIRQDWYRLWSHIAEMSGGDFDSVWGPQVIERIIGLADWPASSVHLLNAHRQIGQPGTNYIDLNGEGLIARLSELERPERIKRAENREKFSKIRRFLAEVIEEPDVQIEVSSSQKELNVSIGSKVLPIQSLGTGVHEVLIFATAATVVENEILCIEEPEIHLHPRLQRRLLRYLHEQTNNQYFITTHSAALLDAPNTAIFHLTQSAEGDSNVSRLNVDHGRAAIGFDLGYKASDIVQSNAIVWVEGPSDRIYLKSWIEAKSDFVEGLHFSIMFYGGRLLSHLAIDDASVSDFIALQKINRNVAIVIDSDRRNAGDDINATKKRVLDEVESIGGFGWVTAGREIENYVARSTMELARAKIHPKTEFSVSTSQWDCVYRAKGRTDFHADKIAIARESVSNVDFDVLDLNEKIGKLIDFIDSANR